MGDKKEPTKDEVFHKFMEEIANDLLIVLRSHVHKSLIQHNMKNDPDVVMVLGAAQVLAITLFSATSSNKEGAHGMFEEMIPNIHALIESLCVEAKNHIEVH